MVATVGLLAACAGGEPEQEAGADTVAPSDVGTRPDIAAALPADRGDPPEDLVAEDVVVGDGDRPAGDGDLLTVHFVGADWVSGVPFDATWDRGVAYQFELGADRVIRGWEDGLEGVRAGGRRLLVVPPHLAYGDRGSGERIAPGATLVFIVDVISVESADTEVADPA